MSVSVLYLACVSLVMRYEKEKLWLVGSFSFYFGLGIGIGKEFIYELLSADYRQCRDR